MCGFAPRGMAPPPSCPTFDLPLKRSWFMVTFSQCGHTAPCSSKKEFTFAVLSVEHTLKLTDANTSLLFSFTGII